MRGNRGTARGGMTARSSIDTVSGRKNALSMYMRQGVTDTLMKRLVLEFRIPKAKALKLSRNYVKKLGQQELEDAHRNGVDLNKLVEASKRRKAEEKARRRAEEESAARAQAGAARASRSGSRRPTPKLQIRASGGDADGPGATGRDKGNAFGSRNPVTGRSPTGKNVWTAIAEYNVKMAEVKTQEEWQEKLARRKKFNETLQQQVAAKRRIKERERRVQVRSRKLVDTDYREHVKVEEEKKKRLLDAALVEKRMRDQQMVAKRQREYKAREEV